MTSSASVTAIDVATTGAAGGCLCFHSLPIQSRHLTSLVRNAFDILRLTKVDHLHQESDEAKSTQHHLKWNLALGVRVLGHHAYLRRNRKKIFNQRFSYFIERKSSSSSPDWRGEECHHGSRNRSRSSSSGSFLLLADAIIKRRFRHFVQKCKVARCQKHKQRAEIEVIGVLFCSCCHCHNLCHCQVIVSCVHIIYILTFHFLPQLTDVMFACLLKS